MAIWKLSVHGDDFEKKYWPIIQNDFPNYEVFWSEFIIPMTNRNELPKGHPFFIHPKKNIDADLQNISMAHYTIFRCFLVAHELINLNSNDSNKAIYADRLDLIYCNFGTIIDMVSNIFFFLANLQFRFGLRQNFIQKKNYVELGQVLKKFFEVEYDDRIRNFEKTKRPISINIHAIPDFIFEILGRTPETKSFDTFSKRIKTIRNAAVHNPIIGRVNGKLIPKLDKLKKYYLWGELFDNFDSNDFVDREVMFRDDFKRLSLYLNSIWDKLILKYREVSEISSFSKLLGETRLFKQCSKCKGDMEYSEMRDSHFPESYDENKKEFILSSDSRNFFITSYWSCKNCNHKEKITVKETGVSGWHE